MHKNNLINFSNFSQLDEYQLASVDGGFIPVAVWTLWAGAGAAGFSGGIAVGLNKVNRSN
ncbi:MAG: class IIb bacteriocin, lactobin A/cerein 7B family [Leuconostoc suionicum]|uniref:class IIb bacteriocin, lactobin A/cerein 7B family n=1 Tax=Leuconostoc suionicum TaxID=1511761 RepID=UPI003F351298